MGAMKGNILGEYIDEVVNKGAEAVLPQNLPDMWLSLLLYEAESFQAGGDNLAGLLASVLRILDYQQGGAFRRDGKMEVEREELFKCMSYYAGCLAVEEIHRRTDIHGEPPTLENIFDANRALHFTRAGDERQ
jgi:hypothetical protein